MAATASAPLAAAAPAPAAPAAPETDAQSRVPTLPTAPALPSLSISSLSSLRSQFSASSTSTNTSTSIGTATSSNQKSKLKQKQKLKQNPNPPLVERPGSPSRTITRGGGAAGPAKLLFRSRDWFRRHTGAGGDRDRARHGTTEAGDENGERLGKQGTTIDPGLQNPNPNPNPKQDGGGGGGGGGGTTTSSRNLLRRRPTQKAGPGHGLAKKKSGLASSSLSFPSTPSLLLSMLVPTSSRSRPAAPATDECSCDRPEQATTEETAQISTPPSSTSLPDQQQQDGQQRHSRSHSHSHNHSHIRSRSHSQLLHSHNQSRRLQQQQQQQYQQHQQHQHQLLRQHQQQQHNLLHQSNCHCLQCRRRRKGGANQHQPFQAYYSQQQRSSSYPHLPTNSQLHSQSSHSSRSQSSHSNDPKAECGVGTHPHSGSRPTSTAISLYPSPFGRSAISLPPAAPPPPPPSSSTNTNTNNHHGRSRSQPHPLRPLIDSPFLGPRRPLSLASFAHYRKADTTAPATPATPVSAHSVRPTPIARRDTDSVAAMSVREINPNGGRNGSTAAAVVPTTTTANTRHVLGSIHINQTDGSKPIPSDGPPPNHSRTDLLNESGTEADTEAVGFTRHPSAPLFGPSAQPVLMSRRSRGSGRSRGSRPARSLHLISAQHSTDTSTTAAVNKENESSDLKPSRKSDISPVMAAYLAKMAVQREEAERAERAAGRALFVRRRRQEFGRRGLEVGLVVAILYFTVLSSPVVWTAVSTIYRPELVATLAAVLVMTVAYYPIRLAITVLSSPTSASGSSLARKAYESIRIPAYFDPAPVLYPALIPVLVVLSIPTMHSSALLFNLVLALSSLPVQLASPLGLDPETSTTIHWLISLIPIAAASRNGSLINAPPHHHHHQNIAHDPVTGITIAAPDLGSLFLLHHAIAATLHSITKSSLLGAELHLFTVGLLNLLFFASSPPLQVLRAILWPGGVLLVLLCSPLVTRSIALDKLPRWRLRRRSRSSENGHSHSPSAPAHPSRSPRPTNRPFFSLILSSLRPFRTRSKVASRPFALTALSSDQHSGPDNYDVIPTTAAAITSTSTTTGSSPQSPRSTVRPQTRSRPPSLSPLSASFLSLTVAQADRRQWVYAASVYGIIIAVLFGPVRYCVGKSGMSGFDPFGWAVGYLFGNIPSVRFRIMHENLSEWAPLPVPLIEHVARQIPVSAMSIMSGLSFQNPIEGLIERERQAWIGVATTRLLITVYAGAVVALGFGILLFCTANADVDTRRKLFHAIMVAIFHALPTPAIDPYFCSLALALMLVGFLLLDFLRASRLPPLSRALSIFLDPYIDGRDVRGPVVISHIFLLLGCTLPLWFTLADIGAVSSSSSADPSAFADWDSSLPLTRPLSLFTGFICVGMGDAAASLIGRRFGSVKWPWAGSKSVQGSVAFTVAVFAGLLWSKMWLVAGGWQTASAVTAAAAVGGGGGGGAAPFSASWPEMAWMIKCVVVAGTVSMVEAVATGVNDNLLVPVALWLCVRAAGL